MDNWEAMVSRYGEPVYGSTYFCKLKCHSNKDIEKYALLKAVDKDDHLWEFEGEELNNNFSVSLWIDLCLINKVQRERIN